MLQDHQEFIDAIAYLKEVEVMFSSADDDYQTIIRRCAPMDYGPVRITKPPEVRYHFWDMESDGPSNHPLLLRADQITQLVILESVFDPASFVTWTPTWHIPRTTWGAYN